jgi:hypothetical protein
VILIVSNAQDATADFFEHQLIEGAVDYVRLNTNDLRTSHIGFEVNRARTAGTLEIRGREIRLSDLKSIYYRRPRAPELEDMGDPGLRTWMQNEYRRAWGGLLHSAPHIRWVNHPIAVSAASYKPEQLARAARAGFAIPDTLMANNPTAALSFCTMHNWNVVAKPIGHGEVRGDDPENDRVVYTNRISAADSGLLERVAECPTLLQAHIEKAVDLRVTVVDDACLAVALHSQERPISSVDCRRDNMSGMRYSEHDLPRDLAHKLIAFTRSYDLYFAAIDLVLDPDGTYWFLELNPAGQWAWLEQEIGIPISAALIRCLIQTAPKA